MYKYKLLILLLSIIFTTSVFAQPEYKIKILGYKWNNQTKNYIDIIINMEIKNKGTESGYCKEIEYFYLSYSNTKLISEHYSYDPSLLDDINPNSSVQGNITFRVPKFADNITLSLPDSNGGAKKLICKSYNKTYGLKESFIITDSAIDYYNLASDKIERKEFREAIILYSKAIFLNPLYYNAFLSRGNAYRTLEEYSSAIDDYNEAIRLDSLNKTAILERAYVYVRTNEYNKALMEYQSVLNVDKNDYGAHFWRGYIYEEYKDYTRAINEYSKCAEEFPNDGHAYLYIGKCYYYLNNYDNALTNLDKSIKLSPDNEESYFYRGLVYNMLEDFIKAVGNYSIAIQMNPNYEMYFWRSSAYMYLGLYNDALEDATKGIELKPYPGLYHLRGIIHYALDKYYEACKDVRIAYSLGDIKAKDLIDEYCK